MADTPDYCESAIRITPRRRRRLIIRLGRSISVKEIEDAVEEFLEEALLPDTNVLVYRTVED